jgi:hypothetical protein
MVDGNKLFSALPLDNRVRLGYSKQREIYINLYGVLTHKLDAFKEICTFFDDIKNA